MLKRSWPKVLIGPILGLVIAPLSSVPITRVIHEILWTTGNHMPGKLFIGVVTIPTIYSIYIICFICFGALFAPAKRIQVATALYITGSLIVFYLLWDFPSPIYSPKQKLTLWQPFAITFLTGSLAYATVLILERRAKKRANNRVQ